MRSFWVSSLEILNIKIRSSLIQQSKQFILFPVRLFVRALKSHALSVSLAHFDTISRSHADTNISHVLTFSRYQWWSQISEMFQYYTFKILVDIDIYNNLRILSSKIFWKAIPVCYLFLSSPLTQHTSQEKNLALCKIPNLRALICEGGRNWPC